MAEETTRNDRRSWSLTRVVAATLAAALPLAGLASLLLRSELDPHIQNYRGHFIVFGIVGGSRSCSGRRRETGAATRACADQGQAELHRRVRLIALPN